ncbi:MAG: hypothetical protein ATN35_02625 [Epulopiscium sp. Nele67-Bin004]|nr:MAG: hypothetical protein ATN35_02625 [Epulopiscium sp. Nele67-Bin004]
MNLDRRVERILGELGRNNAEVKLLRKIKEQIFIQSDEYMKDVLLEYEELESMELEIVTKVVYVQAVRDTLNRKNTISKNGFIRTLRRL